MGGDLHENGCFIEGKRVKSSKLRSKTDHWSLLLRSFEGMLAIGGPGSDFIYTKNFGGPGSDFIYTKISARTGSNFIYTKNSAWPGADFIYTKNFLIKITQKQ